LAWDSVYRPSLESKPLCQAFCPALVNVLRAIPPRALANQIRLELPCAACVPRTPSCVWRERAAGVQCKSRLIELGCCLLGFISDVGEVFKMFLVSQLIELAGKIGGPRLTHQIYLRQLERWRTYEPEYYILDRLVDSTRAAIDVGANEGIYSGRMAQLTKQVYCFEPIPWFAEALRKKLSRSTVVCEIALSNREGTGELRIPYRDDLELHGTTTLEAGNPLSGSTHVKVVQCSVRKLDDCVSEPVGFIKVDVEGHELAVLEGAKHVLETDRPTVLVESERRHNVTAPESIFSYLEQLGYAGFFLREGRTTSLSAFDRSVDQAEQNIPDIHSHKSADERRAARQPYINNFIFIPQENAVLMAKMANIAAA
jgi:FkbM family methyltransferase